MASIPEADVERSLASLRGVNILSLMGRRPWPMNDGWKMRSGNLLRVLAKLGASIDLVAFRDPSDQESGAAPDYIRSVHDVPRRRAYAISDLLAGALMSTPFSVLNYRDAVFAQRVSEISAANTYDLLLVEDVVMAQYASSARAGIKWLDMHNVESHLMRRYAENERRPLHRLYASLTAAKLARYEANIVRSFDSVLTCSAPDKDRLVDLGVSTPINVVPNGIDPQFFADSATIETDESIVFVGSMDYHANVSGVQYFLRDILPLIRRAHPASVTYVVGKNPPTELQECREPGVVVTGTVPDVRPYLSKAGVVIVPLTVGGGTRLKILEAMAMGKAVVSTTIGCEGIDAHPGRDIVIADSPESFAQEVGKLLRDPLTAKQIGESAKQFVIAEYDWQNIVGRLANRLHGSELVATR